MASSTDPGRSLSLNPSKISGNCGRLLCCLRYEVDSYVEVKRRFPQVGAKVTTKVGTGILQRVDYFREEMVLIGEDAIPFRAKAEDILSVTKGVGPAGGAPRGDFEERAEDVEMDSEALKHLDEPENLN